MWAHARARRRACVARSRIMTLRARSVLLVVLCVVVVVVDAANLKPSVRKHGMAMACKTTPTPHMRLSVHVGLLLTFSHPLSLSFFFYSPMPAVTCSSVNMKYLFCALNKWKCCRTNAVHRALRTDTDAEPRMPCQKHYTVPLGLS